jgi:hypothetical protein
MALAALALEAWVWLAPLKHHRDESRIAAALILACNAMVVATVCAEVVRRRRGFGAPAFWLIALLTVAAGIVNWVSWRLIF